MAAQPETVLKNEHYDIVSVLYHTLQGAETCQRYVRDAEQEGDTEVAEFLRDVQEQNLQMAQRAKRLLASRVGS